VCLLQASNHRRGALRVPLLAHGSKAGAAICTLQDVLVQVSAQQAGPSGVRPSSCCCVDVAWRVSVRMRTVLLPLLMCIVL
jgi:hypothetical protein